ncbi:MAG: hypothetical protein CM15mP28_3920 [Pseudomonadota bacterium]|nr:MAG: hypothetical protein CM15mP28_3920 [Pseudomonadota bacterium]
MGVDQSPGMGLKYKNLKKNFSVFFNTPFCALLRTACIWLYKLVVLGRVMGLVLLPPSLISAISGQERNCVLVPETITPV